MKKHLLFLLFLMGAAQADTSLPVRDELWKKQYFSESGAGRTDETARFAIETEQSPQFTGPVLSLGPWQIGDYSLRYDWTQNIALKGPVTLRGSYRTENLLPGQAQIVVQWLKDGKRLRRDTFDLPDAGTWTAFSVPLRRVPPGAQAFVPGFGLGEKTPAGRVLFGNLKVSDGIAPLDFPADPGPLTRPAPPATLTPPPVPAPEPTDPNEPIEPARVPVAHYRLQQAGEVWWMVTPDNKPFFSLGTDAPDFPANEGAKGREYEAQMRSYGFNSLAGWTNIERWSAINDALQAEGKTPLAAFVTLQSSDLEGEFDVLQSARGDAIEAKHAFPDPFDPRFEMAYRTAALKIGDLVKTKSWLAGYFADNEIAHRDLSSRLWSPHCAAALKDWLKDKYETIDKLNTAWATQFASFDEIITKKPRPTSENMGNDFVLFGRQVVQKYVQITLEAWRDADPDHLVFSNRFMLDEVNDLVPYLDLYGFYDGIGVNVYPANDAPGLSNLEKQRLQTLNLFTRKPVLISEWSIPARDSGLYDKGDKLDASWSKTVDNQPQRAHQTAQVLTDFYNLPFVVGAHWFTWSDINTPERQANSGLVKSTGEPWSDLLASLTSTQQKIQQHITTVR